MPGQETMPFYTMGLKTRIETFIETFIKKFLKDFYPFVLG